mgnify:CR=1 FL=1
MNAREGTGTLNRDIEAIVEMIGRFSGKDVMQYLEAYRAEMIMRDILEEWWLSGFLRVVMLSIHVEVLEVQMVCISWTEFEERLLELFRFDDSLLFSKRELMEWVESSGKGKNMTALFQEFKTRFPRLSVLDRTMLDTGKVLLFIKSVDEEHREKVGLLLKTDDELTADWVVVKRVCGRFDKWRDWGGTGRTKELLWPR